MLLVTHTTPFPVAMAAASGIPRIVTVRRVAGSILVTVSSSLFVTQMEPSPKAMPRAPLPIGMEASTLPVAGSI